MFYHCGCNNRKQHDECIQHGGRSYFLKVIFSEQGKEDGKASNQDGCVQQLAHDVQANLLLVHILALHLLLER